MSTISVPRIADVTGKRDLEQIAAEREWQRARKMYLQDNARYGYTAKGKEKWMERTNKTRSF